MGSRTGHILTLVLKDFSQTQQGNDLEEEQVLMCSHARHILTLVLKDFSQTRQGNDLEDEQVLMCSRTGHTYISLERFLTDVTGK